MNTQTFTVNRLCSTKELREMVTQCTTPYTFLCTKQDIRWVYLAQERMVQVMQTTGARMVYADRFHEIQSEKGIERREAPVIDYQSGALRDDFEFGAVMLFDTQALLQAIQEMDRDYTFAGLYDLRLRISRMGAIEHIPEYLYYEIETDTRKSGEKLFDYVDPKNRNVQIEMEQCVTAHLKAIGAIVDYKQLRDAPIEGEFPVTASVIIPCRNRIRTIKDAIRSALSQKVQAPYTYNVFVVDDNSTDGTQEAIRALQEENSKQRETNPDTPELVYIAQDKTWHAIGGNWNMAVHHEKCGKYAIQLDSDDTYHDETTVQRFIDSFEQTPYGMVIGTYQMTDIDGNILPPGVIDHREWTDENGMNNALRINGLGAPRAFSTTLLRQINFPTTKYGEDYAIGLRISREYRIGRIYEVVYNCRRWEDNSDANCDIVAMNRNNWYKDKLRTWEVEKRRRRPVGAMMD